mmetsp:Transcript_47484/g.132390  ORF Transcript_47484/g.132390 Transcript_47484/m.132390 type:complete len:217 (+) Transcript_47484:78-728(+)
MAPAVPSGGFCCGARHDRRVGPRMMASGQTTCRGACASSGGSGRVLRHAWHTSGGTLREARRSFPWRAAFANTPRRAELRPRGRMLDPRRCVAGAAPCARGSLPAPRRTPRGQRCRTPARRGPRPLARNGGRARRTTRFHASRGAGCLDGVVAGTGLRGVRAARRCGFRDCWRRRSRRGGGGSGGASILPSHGEGRGCASVVGGRGASRFNACGGR